MSSIDYLVYLLDTASRFDVRCKSGTFVAVELGQNGWVIREGEMCLNTSGEWEPMGTPSSRSEEWVVRCRWTDRDEAIKAAQECEP